MSGLGRILGIDYGERRIGLAVSDPTCVVAHGLPTIHHQALSVTLETLGDLIREYDVASIVLGLPLTMQGRISETAERARKFGRILEERFSLPVTLLDERFTSVIAEQTLRDLGKKPSRNKAKIDEIAATIILQDYLNKLLASE